MTRRKCLNYSEILNRAYIFKNLTNIEELNILWVILMY